MRHTEKCNPYAEKAEARRAAWEAEQPKWWQKKRFDALDLFLLLLGTNSLLLLLLEIFG